MQKTSKLFPIVVVLTVIIIVGVMVMSKSKDASNPQVAYKGHGGTFKNALAELDTPDPSIAYKDGFYYMTFTHNGADVMVMKSRTLDFRGAQRQVVWYPPVDTMYSANLWAPEIQYLNGKWYIYFAADNGINENHRMYALEADTDDPMGTYTFKGQVTDETNKWAIDGLVLEHEDKLYFVWSGWEGDVNVQQNTYIAPMSNPYTISGPRVLLSEPDLDWERAGGPPYINEGQAVLHKNGRVFIAYSGAGSWTPFYSIGLLTLEEGGDPLHPASWTKSEQPLMEMDSEAGVYGPGHNTFVTSPDGSEEWIVYHATSGETDGWNNRKARAGRIRWGADGLPNFDKPLSLATAIEVPSGSGVYRVEHSLRDGDSIVYDGISSSIDTTAPMLLHYKNETDADVTMAVSVNGLEAGMIVLAPTQIGELGYAYADIPLASGQNEVGLLGGSVSDHVVAIEIARYEAEYAELSVTGEQGDNPYASGGLTAVAAEGDKDAIRFANVQVPSAGKYTLRFAVTGKSEEELEMRVSVNGGNAKKAGGIQISNWGEFTVVSVDAELRSGTNTIVIGKATGELELDYMDIVPLREQQTN